MKILKIFGIVVGVHVFALILIFANPGCSSSTKSKPKPAETAIETEPSPVVTVPSQSTVRYAADSPFSAAPLDENGNSPVMAAPISFNPDAPATSGGVRFSPTRPNTPAASTLQAQPVADVTPASAYTVVKGDSLWSVAKSHHLTVGELASANNLTTGTTLRLGQKLLIPVKAGAVTAAAATTTTPAQLGLPAPKPSTEAVTHVVKAGETLGAIARKYQVTVGEIATANNITDPAKIRPGRELIIPGWRSPTARPANGGSTATTAAVAAPKPAAPATSLFNLPPPDQDLDAGLKKAGDAPVIKVEEADPNKPL